MIGHFFASCGDCLKRLIFIKMKPYDFMVNFKRFSIVVFNPKSTVGGGCFQTPPRAVFG